MERLVTDTPESNFENALNLFFAKDGEAWIRGYGENGEDITLNCLMSRIIKSNRLMIDTDNDEEMQQQLNDALDDGINSTEGIAALLYTAGWAFAELRARLASYESAGIIPGVGEAKSCIGWPSPFDNDPFAMVWKAFRNLYPDKNCMVYIGHPEAEEENGMYGRTIFPDDGTMPQVCIYAEHSLEIQVETLGHELAHVAVGASEDHNEKWEEAFDAIFQEYNRIADEMFGGDAEEESHEE